MKLKVVGSSSAGNCYLLENDKEALVIEAGCHLKEIKKLVNFNTSKIVGVLVSHAHQDHSRYASEFTNAAIKVYAPDETIHALQLQHNAIAVTPKKPFKLKGFTVMAFELAHDVKCFGYLINHEETGKFVFITDTHYCPAKFKGLNNIIVEANYSQKIVKQRLEAGNINRAYYERVLRSHMSLETTIGFLKANDLSGVNNIVLIHLSDGNSDANGFVRDIAELTGKCVSVADKGTEIDFNSKPF